jgi:hypothetical protein
MTNAKIYDLQMTEIAVDEAAFVLQRAEDERNPHFERKWAGKN